MAQWGRWALVAAALVGCSGGRVGADRAAWLQEALRTDNLVWLSREPQLVADKLARMASDPYDFMRGSAAIDAADRRRVEGVDEPLAALDQPGLATLVFGDAHPENLGTAWPGAAAGPIVQAPDPEGLVLSFFDPDAITYAPPLVELQRASLGFAALRLAPQARAGCPRSCAESVASALGAGWAAAVVGEALDDEGLVVGALRLGAADAEQLLSERLSDVEAESGLLARSPLDPEGRGQLDLRPHERAQLARLWPAIAEAHGLRLLDAARRYGSGVSSIPAVRLLLLVDTGEAGPADDRVLDLRELVDPPALAVAGAPVAGVFADNADRVERGAAALWPQPDADPFLMGLVDGAQCFRLRGWRGAFASLDHLEIADGVEAGALAPADLAALAFTAGWTLGAAHARAPGPDGTAVGPRLRGALRVAGGAEGVSAALAARVWGDLDRLEDDHLLLQALIAEHGPLAGIEADANAGAWGEVAPF